MYDKIQYKKKKDIQNGVTDKSPGDKGWEDARNV